MKKVIVLSVVLLCVQYVSGFAPVDSVGTKWVQGKKYIEHKVDAHEGWFGIARRYNIPYSDLRIANKDDSDSLQIGQVILVPVEKGKASDPRNLKNNTQKVPGQKEPILHAVKKKETLYSIAKKYAVTPEEIKKWNQLDSDNLKKGDQLIVGFKKEKKSGKQKIKETEMPAEEKTEVKRTPPIMNKPEDRHDSIVVTAPAAETKTEADSQGVVPKIFNPKGRKQVAEQGVATWIDDENINPNKYFALHRTAPVGGIVKVTNRMNKRSVFVKVVGKLPETGDNENIVIKISRASAEKLGVRDQRFQCDLTYGVSEK